MHRSGVVQTNQRWGETAVRNQLSRLRRVLSHPFSANAMNAADTRLTAQPRAIRARRRAPDIAGRIARRALASAWSLRHPQEPLSEKPSPSRWETVWVQTPDGWELPLSRVAARPGGRGEPVLISAGLGLGPHTVDAAPDRSLVRKLRSAGFDVWWFTHRGCADSRAPSTPTSCDVDAIAQYDIPTALDKICETTGAPQVLWVGHGLGGQVALVHLAHHGGRIAAMAALATPVAFPAAHTHQKVAGLVARLLPAEWRIPLGTVADLLAPGPGANLLVPYTGQCDATTRRGLLIHGTQAARMGMVRQLGVWMTHGHLCDRTGEVDYALALETCAVPMLVVTAQGDPLCPPRAVAPLMSSPQRRAIALPETWSHHDMLMGAAAPSVVFDPIVTWLSEHRDRVWNDW